jgi:nucleotide sugar dehydrogenase
MENTKEKYIIIGFGWVGQANALALSRAGFDVSYFDPVEQPHHYTEYASAYDSVQKLRAPLAQDSTTTWYIVCVGDRVSEDGVQDILSIEKALDSLKDAKGGVILRSTILPDSLERLRFDFYVPEFLHEKKAVEECANPHFFVVGSKTGRENPGIFAYWRANTRKVFEGTPREASFIKYFSNLWNAMRIAFVNEFGDVMHAPTSKKDVDEVSRVVNFLFDGHSYLRYGRGFGGHCLPKDTRAFAGWYNKSEKKVPLIAAMYESNTRHEKLGKDSAVLPEWFSEWQEAHISGWAALAELWYALKKNALHPLRSFKRSR